MTSDDHLTDEEALADGPTRQESLKTAVLARGRKLGGLTVRPMTAETLSFLFERRNFFISAMRGERVSPANANPVWATAEFIYIHAGDEEEVAESVWIDREFRANVRAMLRGPLNEPSILTAALPIIEQMVGEYFAAQSEPAPQPHIKGLPPQRPGKGSARHGRPATSPR